MFSFLKSTQQKSNEKPHKNTTQRCKKGEKKKKNCYEVEAHNNIQSALLLYKSQGA